MNFSQRLAEATSRRGRLCVGIDPHVSLLEAWGLPTNADGIARFTAICVEAFAEVAVVKPQIAFYEPYGARGFSILQDAIKELRSQGVLVIADAKRGDIGSTMAGYARAWLGHGAPLESDAVTVSPYLGVGALQPAFDVAEENGKGVYVLAATSNPEAIALQGARFGGETSVAQHVVDSLAEINASSHAETVGGNLGIVLGATVANPPSISSLHGPILLPGVGAQGATMRDIDRLCGADNPLALPSVSRGILKHGPSVHALKQVIADFVDDSVSR